MPDVMNSTDIAFPNLGIYLENVPKSFSVFGISIAYYGVIIGIAIISGIFLATHEAKVTGQDPDIYWDFVVYAIIFSIIGARAYYVVFSWDKYKDDLLSIFNLRQGGLAIYGAVIAAFLTLFVYTRVKHQNFFQMADTAVPGLALGQVIGRWGNFMNREAFGDYTDNLLAMALPVDAIRENEITQTMLDHMADGVNYVQVHPTFLYESLWNLCLVTFLLFYQKRKKFEGEVMLFYLAGYGIGRFWIEGLRTDQLLIPQLNIPISQVIGITAFVICVAADILVRMHAVNTKESLGESRSLKDNQRMGKDNEQK